MADMSQGSTKEGPRIANCDYEAWVLERLSTLVRVILAIKDKGIVAAAEDIINFAIQGAIDGAAIEVIHALDMEPEYCNLPKRERGERWRRKHRGVTPTLNPGEAQ